MFFVLVQHANFLSIGTPVQQDAAAEPVGTFIRFFVEALCIVAVNVFVFISGWFGIRYSHKGVLRLFFQCVFFAVVSFCIAFLLPPPHDIRVTLQHLKGLLLLNGDWWFIKAYIILYVLSPVLNCFVQYVSEREYRRFICVFYVLYMTWGWLMPAAAQFSMNGSTAISFIGIYLLGRYMRIYPHRLTQMNWKMDMIIYIVIVSVISVSAFVYTRLGGRAGVDSRIYSYANPLVIMGAVYLSLAFSKKPFQSRWVNTVASSCLAVYLLHCNGYLYGSLFSNVIRGLWMEYGLLPFLGITVAYLVAIYVVAIILDQIRLVIWNRIMN